MGFEHMTFAIPVQCSTNWANHLPVGLLAQLVEHCTGIATSVLVGIALMNHKLFLILPLWCQLHFVICLYRMVFWFWICDPSINKHMAVTHRSCSWITDDACTGSEVSLTSLLWYQKLQHFSQGIQPGILNVNQILGVSHICPKMNSYQTFEPLTSIKFLLTISPLNQTLKLWEQRKWSLLKKLLIILKFTWQPGGQSDIVWCYSGLQV